MGPLAWSKLHIKSQINAFVEMCEAILRDCPTAPHPLPVLFNLALQQIIRDGHPFFKILLGEISLYVCGNVNTS